MNIFLKNIYLLFAVALFSACSSQNEKVVVEGGVSEISTSTEENENATDTSDNENISIEDNLSEDEKALKIINEKLTEVGDRVFFDYDQSRFKKEGIETLKRQARFLIENQTITITIEGHCDARGTREYNLALGERRAYSVKSFLTSLGVEESRISVISFGKEKLPSLENNESAWAQSRTAITVINP
jgi:peptidoglycan-associated lipoprotein